MDKELDELDELAEAARAVMDMADVGFVVLLKKDGGGSVELFGNSSDHCTSGDLEQLVGQVYVALTKFAMEVASGTFRAGVVGATTEGDHGAN